jgi:hypothetical protein
MCQGLVNFIDSSFISIISSNRGALVKELRDRNAVVENGGMKEEYKKRKNPLEWKKETR